MVDNVKVFIATPMYGGQCTGFYMQSILQLQQTLSMRGYQVALSMMFNESLITRGRNALAHQFLKTDFTHLLFIDADIRFDPEQVALLFDAHKDVICGIYPKKEINWHSVEQAVKAGVPTDQLKHHTGSWVINLVNYQATVDVPQNEPLEVWAGGTGMMLIKREVFEKMKEWVPSYLNDVVDLHNTMQPRERIAEYFATSIEPGTERLLSEDYHFCRVWRENGGQIYAAPWMDLGHVGTYVFEGRLLQTS
jgi:hypothetical protein